MSYGNVYQDCKSKHWYIQLRWDGKTERFYQFEYKTKWLPFESKGMADHTLSLMRNEIKDNCFNPKTWRKDSPLGIKEYSKIWLETSSACKNTKKIYRNAICHAMRYFGEDYDIRKFTHSQLLLFLQSLTLSESAKYNVMTALKTMLRFYHKDVPQFVLPTFPPMTKPEPETTAYLTYEEQQKVLEAIPERHRPIFIVMMEYGIRPQEAQALKWDCVDFEKNEITFIDRQGDEIRSVEYLHYSYPHQMWEKLKNFKSLTHEIDTWYCEFGKGRKRNILSDTDLETALLKALVWQIENK